MYGMDRDDMLQMGEIMRSAMAMQRILSIMVGLMNELSFRVLEDMEAPQLSQVGKMITREFTDIEWDEANRMIAKLILQMEQELSALWSRHFQGLHNPES